MKLKVWGVLPALLILMMGIAIVMAQPAPFVISGWVTDTGLNPINDPNIVITNTNTGEEFIVKTNTGSNYYHAISTSHNVSMNDVLSFNVNGNDVGDHTVTDPEISSGGFELDLITGQTAGMCGDVTGNNIVDTGDVILLSNFVGYYPGMPQYALNSTQQCAGDVTGNGIIDTGDVILLSNYVGYSGYSLNCSCGI